MRYLIQRSWIGETAFILGGGPSLRNFDPDFLRGKGKVIAINEAGLSMCPWAHTLFFGDYRWYDWNKSRLSLFQGKEFVTRGHRYMYPQNFKVLRWDSSFGIHPHPQRIGGWCSGGSALDYVYKRGCHKIFLFGFDMNDVGEANWHTEHKEPPIAGRKAEKFIPTIVKAAETIKNSGVKVFNVSPQSALCCFPKIDFVEFEREFFF